MSKMIHTCEPASI